MLSPSPPPRTGSSIDPVTGIVTVARDATTDKEGYTYDVIAMGIGAYQGTVQSSIAITVSPTTITGDFSYDNLSVTVGDKGRSTLPMWNNHRAGETFTYTIARNDGDEAPAGITIDDDGIVRVARSAKPAATGTYTVTATGDGDYAGIITADITITINTKSITGTFAYAHPLRVPVVDGGSSAPPIWTGALSGQRVSYAIARSGSGDAQAGITIGDDGKVTVGTTAPLDATGTYTVSATGDGDYAGSQTTEIMITINRKVMVGTLMYDPLTVIKADSGTATASPTSGGISTAGVQYTITKTQGTHTGVSINETTGIVTVPNNLALGVSEYEITVSKQDYQSKTAVLTVNIIMDPGIPLVSITHNALADTRTYTFTVNWNNGAIQGKKVNGSLLVANEIPYEIHYAWEKKIEALARTRTITIAEIQGMGTHKKHSIVASSTLPTTAKVKEYMGADQRVYVYVEAINSTDRTKHTISAVQHYDTAIAYTKIAAAGGSKGDHTVGLKRDETVWAWGGNDYGQLGDGNSGSGTERKSPVQVQGLGGVGHLGNITAIAASENSTVAVDNSKTVWAWGNSNTLVKAQRLTNVTAIAAGYGHTVALKDDETVWAWGGNDYGQLGDGNSGSGTERKSPVQVKGVNGSGHLEDVAVIAASFSHAVALKNDRTVWAWGANGDGQLGDGNNTDSTSPVQVQGEGGTGYLGNITAIAGGSGYTIALKDDGTIWAWGNNGSGQLGDGSTNDSNTPGIIDE